MSTQGICQHNIHGPEHCFHTPYGIAGSPRMLRTEALNGRFLCVDASLPLRI